MFDDTCPRCGAEDEVQGRPTDTGVELSCDRCGHIWPRGGPRCRACSGTDSTTRPQRLSVNPRGNQYATVGVVETRLCPRCDAEVLASTHPGHWLPDGYPSRFVNGRRQPPRMVQPPARTQPAALKPPPPPAPDPPSSEARKLQPKPAITNPTVRQAVESSLTDHPGLDSGVITLFALRLGSATRLDSIRPLLRPAAIQSWLDSARLPKSAPETTAALIKDWNEKGWLG